MVKETEQNRTTVFNDYARYYDLLYRDKDYQAEVDYITRLINRFRPKARSILELGSGTGIHASLLTEKGFTVHGIERSLEMLKRALNLAEIHKQDHPESFLIFTEGDIRTARLPKSFDAVIAMFHVISYQATNEDVNAAFETARHHLNPGGVFIFDVWYGPAVLIERPSVRIKRMADDQTEVTRLAEPVLYPNENRVDVNYHVFVRNIATNTVAELKETHIMRYFFKPEIERIATRAGFQFLHAEEWLFGKAIGCDTWGVCFVLKTA
ncbi:MAG: class I SAM-dependent methyltransferase [Syntrophorhabdaceae bacterium]|nr:class I SAM-dependent methyltransferase [Syntrophorhabdaceae bacterium]